MPRLATNGSIEEILRTAVDPVLKRASAAIATEARLTTPSMAERTMSSMELPAAARGIGPPSGNRLSPFWLDANLTAAIIIRTRAVRKFNFSGTSVAGGPLAER